jgi:predicted ATP-dependent endonuclease of OLD family
MNIKKVKIENFRSIERLDESFDKFNVLVGQNNHGKTNFFEALNWFFAGFDRSTSKTNLIFSEANQNAEMLVEITFDDLQNAIENISNETKKTALRNIFSEIDEITIRRTTEFDSGKKRQLFNPQKEEWENVMGADGTWNDLLPYIEYVHTKVSLDDIGSYKSKSPIAEMLSGVLTSIVEQDPKYIQLKEKFSELFGDEDSEVRTKLDELGGKVEVYLQKQFPDDTCVKFNVDIPEFNDLLKKFSTEVDDGVKTNIEEKGDGMQRAVMLSIIQAYADFRKENEILKKFIFLIDEAELHLHPSAQRALKKALLDISSNNDQVFVNTHSSVLVSDNEEEQKIYKVEKCDKKTSISPISTEDEKMDVIFDLLGGSPCDLLLPKNFLICEGRSEYEFLKIIKSRFYPTLFEGIKIIYARGDMNREAEVFHAIHEAYRPLFADGGVYKDKVVIICDQPNSENQSHYDTFMTTHNWIAEGEQMHKLPVDALEKYYPNDYKKDDTEIAQLVADRKKVEYAKEVAQNITQEQFEQEMSVIFNALNKARDKSFQSI